MKRKLLAGILWLFFNVSYAQVQHQSALHFDGTDDYVSNSQAGNAVGTSAELTLAFWVKPLNAAPNWPSFDGFAGFRNDVSADFYIVQLSSFSIECRFRGSSGIQSDIIYDSLTLYNWQHFALVKTTSMMYLYHNAQLKDSVGATGSMSNPGSFNLGRLVYSFNNFDAWCEMDEVGLWNRALSASEVQCLYTRNIPENTTNLVLGYTFNDGIPDQTNALTQVADINGNLPGTLNGFALQDSVSNFVNGVNPYPVQSAIACIGESYIYQGDTLSNAGTYYYDFAGSNGCDSLVALDLQFVSGPDTTFSISTPGGTSYIVSAQLSGATYQWCNCNGATLTPISGATQQTYNAGTGNVSIALVVGNGSCSDTSSCHVLSSIESVSEKVLDQLFIRPNPATGVLFISGLELLGEGTIRLHDSRGRLIFEKQVNNQSLTNGITLDLPGVYSLTIETRTSSRTYKVLNMP